MADSEKRYWALADPLLALVGTRPASALGPTQESVGLDREHRAQARVSAAGSRSG